MAPACSCADAADPVATRKNAMKASLNGRNISTLQRMQMGRKTNRLATVAVYAKTVPLSPQKSFLIPAHDAYSKSMKRAVCGMISAAFALQTAPSPPEFRVRLETTKGAIVV